MKDENGNVVYKIIQYGVIFCAALAVLVPATSSFRLVKSYFELSRELEELKGKEPEVDAMINISRATVQGDAARRIFELLSLSAKRHEVIVRQMYLPVKFASEGVEFQSLRITLQGGYTDVLKCLQTVEQDLIGIKIVSIRFSRVEKNKVSSLLADIYFQNIQPGD